MSHLMKDADGHLVVRSDGHLARCATVNNCSPPLPCVIRATFAGLGGIFAPMNGAHDAPLAVDLWPPVASYRLWDDPPGAEPLFYVAWFPLENLWRVRMTIPRAGGACIKQWTLASTACAPTGNYAEEGCNCGDGHSCADSAGATCVVSYL